MSEFTLLTGAPDGTFTLSDNDGNEFQLSREVINTYQLGELVLTGNQNGSAVWGLITGTLESQTDLKDRLLDINGGTF